MTDPRLSALRLFLALLAFAFAAPTLPQGTKALQPFEPAARPAEEKPFSESDWVDDRWTKTEVGHFLHSTLQMPGQKVAKALSIQVGENGEATVAFDTDLMRYAAAWEGEFVKIPDVRYGLMAPCAPGGEIQFSTEAGPGWAKNDSFEDPRPRKLGPLPRGWAKYKGFYQHGKRVVLSYTVGDVNVLDSPWFEKIDGMEIFTRTVEIGPAKERFSFKVAETTEAHDLSELSGRVSFVTKGSSTVGIAVIPHGKAEASISAVNSAHNVQVQPHAVPVRVRVLIARLTAETKPKFKAMADSLRGSVSKQASLASFMEGGPSHWPALTTTGHVDRADSPLAIDTITIPYENPWNALFFLAGHDFFSNGDAAVAAIHGDVWRVSGIDDSLRKITWKRFATGLYQPLGLKIVNDKVHVLERDQITILHDLNNDGEADFYENFNNDTISAGGSHSYATSLKSDSEGNFYFAKCAENTPFGGTLVKVAKDGSPSEVVATGFRNPNGLGIGPGDLITVADQQGEWVPETRLDLIKPGGFYGYMPMHHRETAPKTYDAPLCWIPRVLDNSAGGQVWVPPNTWSALAGQMLHLSFGRCTMMLVLRDSSANPPVQGAVVSLPGRFASGVCRGRFNPKDGNLYVTGLRGWQTSAIRDGCFQRVRYQKPLPMPSSFTIKPNLVAITFSEPLDRELAEDTESYSAEQWNYRWSSTYGSPDISVADPKKEGRDPVKISGARLQPDGKTVHLRIEGLRPVMQLAIQYNLETAGGEPLQNVFYATINRIAE